VTYGSVARGSGCWIIRCEPHVRTRLKRVFPRVPQQAADQIAISDTPENSREPLWFLQRYPMDVTVDAMAHLSAQSNAHVDMEDRLSELLSGRTDPAVFNLAKPPRDYQRLPFTMAQARGGLLLADDLGLGKTISAMCGMVAPGQLPTTVVYPAYLPDHWPEKLAEFAPHLRFHTIKSGQPYPLVRGAGQRRKDLWDELPDVILVTYHKLRGWAETLGQITRYVIFEEVQQLRHDSSEIYRSAKYLADKAQLRMGLSATPIYNYGGEFYWVVNALMPGALGEYHEFVREWCTGDTGKPGKTRLRDPDEFGAYLRREGILLRRTRKEVGRELPPLSVIPHTVDSDSQTLEKLTGDAIALARIIVGRNEQYRGQLMQVSGEFDALMRQATGVAKAPYVAEFVRILVENGEPVLLFGWHRAVYEIWMEALKDLNPMLYTGSESPAQKRAAKQAFLSGESKVLVMSLRSGAGLDGLQYACRTVVFGEMDWSPQVHEQCMGRPHRDGQEEPVTAFYLISNDGSDPFIVDTLGIKREQSDGVINPGGPLAERVDTGENQLRALAAEFLRSKGIVATPPASNAAPLGVSAPEEDEVLA